MDSTPTATSIQVCFVCVCVDGRPVEVAREFQQGYFEGSTVKNAYIDDYDDFPKFPTQLGCQGFVVIDAKGHFATLRSPSLNKVSLHDNDAGLHPLNRVADSLSLSLSRLIDLLGPPGCQSPWFGPGGKDGAAGG